MPMSKNVVLGISYLWAKAETGRKLAHVSALDKEIEHVSIFPSVFLPLPVLPIKKRSNPRSLD